MPDKNAKFPVIPCGVALIRRDREFLIAQRNENDTFGSFWEFPGGKREAGESFEQCLVREAQEELAIGIQVEKKFMEVSSEQSGKIIWLNFYICSHVFGDPRPIECQKVQWVDVMDLHKFKFPPSNGVVIQGLVKNYT